MAAMRRAVIYFVLAALCGLVGAVGLSGELGAKTSTVDGLIVGTHTGHIRGSNGVRSTVYYVDVERLDTLEEVSVRNSPFYDAYKASGETDVTLDIRDKGSGVEDVSAAHYLGHTYEGTTKAEGIGVAIAFFVLTALFLALGIRRVIVVRRKRATAEDVASSPPAASWPPPPGQPA
jgi:hypothetical protein